MATTYDIGDRVRITAAFTDTGGKLSDPTTIRLFIEPPAGPVLAYSYATSTGVVRASSGTYRFDIGTTGHGLYEYRWAGAGNVVSAEEGWFSVRRQRVSS
jgi:hypothetical protein